MVQFNGPHGKVTVSYLRQGGLNPPAPAPKGSFTGKTVLITGCSSGIGYQAALQIASLNPKRLILGTRTLAKGEAAKQEILATVGPSLDSSIIEVIPIECSDLSSVRQFTTTVRKTTPPGTLDCVLLSAGLALPTREVVTDESGHEWPTTFVVNVLAPALLALEFLPLLQSTPGSVVESVNSISYCNVTSEDISPLLSSQDEATGTTSALDFFNNPERWTTQRAYYEAKLMLMFVLEGLVQDQAQQQASQPGEDRKVLFLACCPGQCRTNLYRQFGLGVRAFMTLFNAVIARTAEQGARTLVTGLLLQGEEAMGKMWVNDRFDDWSPGITEEEWKVLQKRVWEEIKGVLGKA
uniref:Short-chain dehydrogenase sdnK n=1 Tax=Sordaria araneosa TaxID=573841 RepID=SDNK_SORAA|nr:RecName: Full=Short-chain dehydrogenase sdnK; AltName: Full=Sordarin/hypoxysordarin biosynthesis cluster protein K [Sordaria araneosa]BAV32155.1 short-chain dehydrogenase/reductase [Sordaria araneosa]